jgi:hypothetical protein
MSAGLAEAMEIENGAPTQRITEFLHRSSADTKLCLSGDSSLQTDLFESIESSISTHNHGAVGHHLTDGSIVARPHKPEADQPHCSAT